MEKISTQSDMVGIINAVNSLITKTENHNAEITKLVEMYNARTLVVTTGMIELRDVLRKDIASLSINVNSEFKELRGELLKKVDKEDFHKLSETVTELKMKEAKQALDFQKSIKGAMTSDIVGFAVKIVFALLAFTVYQYYH